VRVRGQGMRACGRACATKRSPRKAKKGPFVRGCGGAHKEQENSFTTMSLSPSSRNEVHPEYASLMVHATREAHSHSPSASSFRHTLNAAVGARNWFLLIWLVGCFWPSGKTDLLGEGDSPTHKHRISTRRYIVSKPDKSRDTTDGVKALLRQDRDDVQRESCLSNRAPSNLHNAVQIARYALGLQHEAASFKCIN
jgi:hypothetical protein